MGKGGERTGNLGERVCAKREADGLTQKELAELCRVEPGQISKIEHGRSGASLRTRRILEAWLAGRAAPVDEISALAERVDELERWREHVDAQFARLAPAVVAEPEPEMIELRLVADLAAGPWQQADRQPDTVQVPRRLTDGDARHWEVHRVRGTSMHLAGIDDGDLILCRNVRGSGNYRVGDVVCAQIGGPGGTEGTIKRYAGTKEGRRIFEAESDFETDHIDPVPTGRCEIVGVVVARKEGQQWVAVPRGSR